MIYIKGCFASYQLYGKVHSRLPPYIGCCRIQSKEGITKALGGVGFLVESPDAGHEGAGLDLFVACDNRSPQIERRRYDHPVGRISVHGGTGGDG